MNLRGECKHCGEEFLYEYKRTGAERKYCSDKCRTAFKNANRDGATKPRVCRRCKVEKPRDQYRNTRAWICDECRSKEVDGRVCIKCGEMKPFIEYGRWRKTCNECLEADGISYTGNTCAACEYEKACTWLVSAKLAPLCFAPDEKNDPYYLAQLPEDKREYALALMEKRYEKTS